MVANDFYNIFSVRCIMKTLRPSVTVIIPTYNCSLYIDKCIKSVLNQTLTNIEIIVVDDCSSDDTVGLIPANDKIKIIKNAERLGSGLSRNSGIKYSSGEYIAFLDGDDFYPEVDSLKKLYNIAKCNNANIVGGSLFIVDEKSKVEIRDFPGQYFTRPGFVNYSDYQHDGGFYRFIFRKDFLMLNNIAFRDLLRMQDSVFLVESMVASKSFYAIPDYVYAYRKNHKIVGWNERNVKDKLTAIGLILKISRENKLAHLHFLIVKNFYNFFRIHLKEVGGFKNQIQELLKLLKMIDFDLLRSKWNDDKFEYNRLRFVVSFLRSFIFN